MDSEHAGFCHKSKRIQQRAKNQIRSKVSIFSLIISEVVSGMDDESFLKKVALKKIIGMFTPHSILIPYFILLSTKMRVRIVFQVLNQGGYMPFHQQVLLSTFVHDFLPRISSNANIWNFSGLKGQTRVAARGLFYNSQKVTLVFASPDSLLVKSFIESLFSAGSFGLAGLELQPIQALEEKVNFSDNIEKYICISPLVVLSDGLPEKELKQFISPDAESFSDLLYESTMSRMENSGDPYILSGKNPRFEFSPDADYLQKARESDKKFSRIYALEGLGNFNELRGYTLPFFLEAPTEIHEFIFHSGLGDACQFGFGMIDFADRKDRTKLIEIPVGNQQERWA
jgi:CRISPR-associated endoribonuclease Cas6